MFFFKLIINGVFVLILILELMNVIGSNVISQQYFDSNISVSLFQVTEINPNLLQYILTILIICIKGNIA